MSGNGDNKDDEDDGDGEQDWGTEVDDPHDRFDWDELKDKTLLQVLTEMQPHTLEHLRLRDSTGVVKVVIILAEGRLTREVDKLVTEKFQSNTLPPGERN